jgi:AcrR family transcriptional regulator
VTTPRQERAQETRRRIVDVALDLFRQHGYDGTTMRMIAAEAGVSLGSAYYYFGSKEELVLGFYAQLQTSHLAHAEQVLDRESDLEDRLRGVVRAWLDEAAPYKAFAGTFFRTAADPGSPLSPFSEQSRPVRASSIALFGRVLEGTKVSPVVSAELPELLWLYLMGVVLFWVHDDSPGATKTYALVDRATPLVVKLVNLTRYRLLRSAVEDVKRLLTEVKGGSPGPDLR